MCIRDRLKPSSPLEEHQKNVLEGAVPSEYTHDVEATSDANNDFQLYNMQTNWAL